MMAISIWWAECPSSVPGCYKCNGKFWLVNQWEDFTFLQVSVSGSISIFPFTSLCHSNHLLHANCIQRRLVWVKPHLLAQFLASVNIVSLNEKNVDWLQSSEAHNQKLMFRFPSSGVTTLLKLCSCLDSSRKNNETAGLQWYQILAAECCWQLPM